MAGQPKRRRLTEEARAKSVERVRALLEQGKSQLEIRQMFDKSGLDRMQADEILRDALTPPHLLQQRRQAPPPPPQRAAAPPVRSSAPAAPSARDAPEPGGRRAGGSRRRAPRRRRGDSPRSSGGNQALGCVGMFLFVVIFNILSYVFGWGWIVW